MTDEFVAQRTSRLSVMSRFTASSSTTTQSTHPSVKEGLELKTKAGGLVEGRGRYSLRLAIWAPRAK